MLIIIRGNSGCGKTSTAFKLREKALETNPDKKIAIVGQDYLRRKILKEKARPNGDNIGLILQTATYALDHGYHVIVEGILGADKYTEMLGALVEYVNEHYVYYFDISFEETLRRHESKSNAHEFGEKEMREWFKDKDLLGLENEEVIPEDRTQQQIIDQILSATGL